MIHSVKEILVNKLVALGLDKNKAENSIFFPKQADIATRAGFLLDPDKIIDSFSDLEFIDKIWAVKGFININLSNKFYVGSISSLSKSLSPFNKKQKIVYVEYPSVNPNKPWHAGHLRNALLGNSISNILSFYGYKVIRLNYIDDLGLQVAQSLYDYLNNKEPINKKFDHWLGERYVIIAKQMEDKTIESKIREILKRMESGDLRKEARVLAEKCLKAQYETAFLFNIYQDACVFESDVIDLLENAISLLKQKGIIYYKDEGELKGCYVAKSNDIEKVVIRSDGTATYLAKDIAFHMWKFGILKGIGFSEFFVQPNGSLLLKSPGDIQLPIADIAVNIIGMEQSQHQTHIKNILSKDLVHVSYAHVRLPEGRFSGRKGTWKGFTADELFEEAERRAKEINEKVAKEVAKSAIIFSFLRISPDKEIIFKWDEALSMENSGPYLLYSFVRANKILSNRELNYNIDSLDEEELLLAKELSKFYYVIEDSAKHYSPHILVNYLLSLTIKFNSFYSNNRVLNDKREKERLILFNAFKNVLEKGLSLLGINTVEEM